MSFFTPRPVNSFWAWDWYAPSKWLPRRKFRFRQTHLGPNDENQLIITDPRPARPSTPIFKLPNEVLDDIFAYILGFEGKLVGWVPTHQARADLIAVMLSCTRFRRVAERLRYQSLDIFLINRGLAKKYCLLIYRSLMGRPQRLTYCRALRLHFPQYTTELTLGDLDLRRRMENVVSRLKNVQHLTLDGRISSRAMDDLPTKISKYMPQLKTIDFSGRTENSDIIELDNPRPADKNKLGIASVTSLYIEEYIRGPEPLKSLIQWPRALEKFCFRPQNTPYYVFFFATINKMLLPYKETLRHVEIGTLNVLVPGQVFQAYIFSNLDYLELEMDGLVCTPEVAARELFSGSLKTLAIDFRNGDIREQRATGVKDVQTGIKWWEEFLQEMSQLPNHQTARREIVFKNVGRDRDLIPRTSWEGVAPWARTIDKICEDFKSQAEELGVTLSYELGVTLPYELEI